MRGCSGGRVALLLRQKIFGVKKKGDNEKTREWQDQLGELNISPTFAKNQSPDYAVLGELVSLSSTVVTWGYGHNCYEQGIHNRGSCRQAKRHYSRILDIRKSGCYIYEVSDRALLLGGRVNSNTQYRYVAARSYQ